MKNKPPKRRVLTAREKLMRDNYTRLIKWPGQPAVYGVMLTVDVQSFKLDACFRTKPESEWTRDMLAIALAKIEL